MTSASRNEAGFGDRSHHATPVEPGESLASPSHAPRPILYVVDDEPAARDGVRILARSAGIDVEIFATPNAFLERVDAARPGCAVIDVRMPEMSGLELYREMRRRGIHLPVVFLTAYGDVPMAVEAMRNGASDFIEKPYRPQGLLDTVQRAIENDVARRSADERRAAARTRIDRLTPREHEVLRHFIAGETTDHVAAELGLSQKTVYAHRTQILRKLEVQSIAALVRVALESGLRS